VQQLKETNYALGDRDLLMSILREQGYWFFRDVLDPEAVGWLRDLYMDELRDRDLVDAGSSEAVWNRRTPIAIDDGVTSSRFPRLREARAWETFVEHPGIIRFFSDLTGEAPDWLTASDYYRIVPPGQDRGEDAFSLRHQDAKGLPGLDFVTCWIPLENVDPDVGGLAILPGSHRHGMVQDRWFTQEFAPDDAWARADYRVGDVLMFTGTTLHSGMRNGSADRFRFSLDIRLYLPGSRRPVTGPLVSITADDIVIENEAGENVRMGLTDDTYILVMVGNNEVPQPFHRSEALHVLAPGRKVMAVDKDGVALILRPANSAGY
jgi:hypothetical protein